jgi:hypothetical protein
MHNEHHWALANPHVVCMKAFKEQWSINVWARIISDQVIGHYLLPGRLCVCTYHVFLEDDPLHTPLDVVLL